MITYLEPDFNAVEESQLNRWRIFNGSDWVHGFDTKEEAIKRARSWGGTAVGKARFNPATEMNEYLEVEAVKPLVEA